MHQLLLFVQLVLKTKTKQKYKQKKHRQCVWHVMGCGGGMWGGGGGHVLDEKGSSIDASRDKVVVFD